MSIPVSARKQMSDSLKARLKRCGRYSPSPVAAQMGSSSGDITDNDKDWHSPVITPTARRESYLTGKANSAFKSPVTDGRRGQEKHATPVATWGCTSESSMHCCDDVTRRTLVGEFGDKESSTSSSDVSSVDTKALSCDRLHPTIPTQNNDHHCQEERGLKRKRVASCDSDCAVGSNTVGDVDEMLPQLLQRKKYLMKAIADKEEKVRKLKLVKLYRAKNDLETLNGLITKWKTVCQEALLRLHHLTQEPRPTLTQLIDHLHIDHKMISYNVEDESFF